MAGTKRKQIRTDKWQHPNTSQETNQVRSANKKRKLIAPPARPKPKSDSSIKSEASESHSSGGSSGAFSEEEEAAIFGPNAQERGEAETDSDPIVESDTPEQSGEDDGVSWPSDEEEAVSLPPKAIDHQNKTRIEKERPQNGAVSTKSNISAKAAIPETSSSSRQSHVKQKAVAIERKAAKPNADSIARTKKLWERLRRKSHVPLDERNVLVAELFGIISGHIKDFVFKHDSVRVIQTALKYANPEQRQMIATELRGEYRVLAESKYAKFLVGKLLVHGDDRIRDIIVPELYGHVRRMIKHPEGSWILDDIYRGAATPMQKAILLREWYGAEFALFKASEKDAITADLTTILTQQPEKRKPIMHALHDLINQCVQKKTTGFTMLHDAMLQYFLNLQPGSSDAIEFVELLKGDEEGDLLKNLAFTKSGARIVCLALAYSNAKDRKLILRTYKDTFLTLSYDIYGHQVLLAAYDVVDDTVLLAKTIFPELIGKDHASEQSQRNLLDAAIHLHGRVPLLYPFTGQAKSVLSSDDQKLMNEIHTIRVSTSKKDPEVRRKELVASLSPGLLSFIEKNTQKLMSSSFGCQFMTDVLLGSVGDRKPSLDSIAGLVSKRAGVDDESRRPYVGRMLKALVQGGRYNQRTKKLEPSDPPLGFHDILYPKIKSDIIDWAAGDDSFVVVALSEAEGFSFTEELGDILSKGKARLGEAAKAGNKGSQILLKNLR